MSILRTGTRGAAVENLQLQLRRLGLYDGKVTGVFTPGTAKAVKQYETQAGQPADGFVTEAEHKQLKAASLKVGARKGFQPGDKGVRVADLNQDLFALGFLNGKVPSGFGEVTRLAVRRFERANGLKPDGVADLKTEGLLDRQVARLAGVRHPNVKPPPADYRRVSFRGGTMNVRTQVMLRRAEQLWKGGATFSVTQGSYSTGVAASAGTHDGGGALDLSVRGKSAAQVRQMVKSLRQAGFAAWSRGPADGFSPHIHAIAIGDRQAAPLARRQVQSYFAGRNGLANNGLDPNRGLGRPYPTWAAKFD